MQKKEIDKIIKTLDDSENYLIIHKKECCTNWKRSFFYERIRQVDGVIPVPPLEKFSDDCSSYGDKKEYLELQKEHDLKDMPDGMNYYIWDSNDNVTFYETENERNSELWDIEVHGSFDFQREFISLKPAAEYLVENYNYEESLDFSDFILDIYKEEKVGTKGYCYSNFIFLEHIL
jgi:hypothetical protein